MNAMGSVEENNLNNSKDFRKIKNRKIKPKKPKRNNFNNTLYSDNIFLSRNEKINSNRGSNDLSKPNYLNYVQVLFEKFEKSDKNFNYLNSNENQSGSDKAHCSKYMPIYHDSEFIKLKHPKLNHGLDDHNSNENQSGSDKAHCSKYMPIYHDSEFIKLKHPKLNHGLDDHNSNENKSRLAILSETEAELSVTEAEDLLQKINSLEEDEIKKMELFKLNLDKARKGGFISAFVKVLFVFFNNKNGLFVFEHVDGINEEIRIYSFDSSIKVCNSIFREDERVKYVAFNVLYNKDKNRYAYNSIIEEKKIDQNQNQNQNQNHREFTKIERFIKFCKSLIKLVFPCVPYNNEPQNQDDDSENQRMI